MAVQNSLTKGKTANKNEVKVVANGEEFTLTPDTVKAYLVSGNRDLVTMQEVVMFMNLCRFQHLNPWLKEAYLIKYSQNDPAALVTGKDAFLKRAEGETNYDGFKAGIIVQDEDGEVIYRDGSFKLPGESLVGGFAEVFRKDRDHSFRAEVSFEEYAARKKDGSLNSQWSKKPTTMIRKVALVQALREAFPGTLGGMYSAEEKGVDEPIDVDVTEIPQETPQNAQEPTPEQYEQQSFTQGGAADALFGN